MYLNKTFLAIIPARSGSKGLPGKNVKVLNNKPLMAWPIEAGLKSKYIDRLIVSTDDIDYINIAKKYGADAPFIRPKNISIDESHRKDVIEHCLSMIKNDGVSYDYVVFLEPTSPLTTSDDIDRAIEILLASSTAQSIVGISLSESSHPDFLVKLNGGFLEFINKDQESKVLRRQDLTELYFYEGTLYISEVNAYLMKEFYHEQTLGYQVPKWKSLEIDDMDDFVMVEAVMIHRGYK